MRFAFPPYGLADLEGVAGLSPAQVAEAIQYRTLDRKFTT